MPKSKINLELVNQYFGDKPDRAFALSDLELLFTVKSQEWNLPASMTPQTFFQMLLRRTKLKKLELQSQHYAPLYRYSWAGSPSAFSIAISIKKDAAFFSHGSAVWIHGLSEDSKNIFINREQSRKPRNSGELSQEAIDRAFRNEQRRSKLVYNYRGATITLLGGKHTARLAVELTETPSGH